MEKQKLTKKGDFVEIEFTGIIKDGEIFDTNVPADAKKINLEVPKDPFIICIGKDMVIKGLDKELEGKEIGKKYTVELSSDNAFGPRKGDLIKLMPKKAFLEKNINPQPGMAFSLDGMLVRIISVSGGRILTDFNNPLAGKDIIYEFKIKKIITDKKEKVDALMRFFFKKQVNFEIKENKILIKDPQAELFVQMFSQPFKDILGMDLSAKKNENKKEEKNDKQKS